MQRDTVIISYLTYFKPLWEALTMQVPNQRFEVKTNDGIPHIKTKPQIFF